MLANIDQLVSSEIEGRYRVGMIVCWKKLSRREKLGVSQEE